MPYLLPTEHGSKIPPLAIFSYCDLINAPFELINGAGGLI